MKRQLALAAVVLLFATAPRPASAEPAQPAPVKAIAPMATPLTDATLRDMLVAMGYEPVSKPATGTTVYQISYEQEGLTWQVDVTLSTNKKFLWISTDWRK